MTRRGVVDNVNTSHGVFRNVHKRGYKKKVSGVICY